MIQTMVMGQKTIPINNNYANTMPIHNSGKNPTILDNKITITSYQNNINEINTDKKIYNSTNPNYNLKKPDELLPSPDHKEHIVKMPNMNKELTNIIFEAYNGFKVVIIAPKDISVKELVNLYMKSIGVSDIHIGKEIDFICHGKKLKIDESNIGQFEYQTRIIVVDNNYIVGA